MLHESSGAPLAEDWAERRRNWINPPVKSDISQALPGLAVQTHAGVKANRQSPATGITPPSGLAETSGYKITVKIITPIRKP